MKKAAIFSAMTGLRFSDIQKLRWEEIEYSEGMGYSIHFKQKKKQYKLPRKIYISALNNILLALNGHHVFDRFGFNLPVRKVKPESRLTLVTDFDTWAYDSLVSDWINTESGNRLTGFTPEDEIAAILKNDMDMVLQ